MSYLADLRDHWRPLSAATLGMASGMSAVGIVTSTIAPTLIADAGWSKSSFAMVGSLSLLMSFVFPFIGRFTDVFGVRRTALVGQIILPLTYLAFSFMITDLRLYVAIFAAQSLLCMTTTATVYTRLPVQYVRQARGLALAVVASGPALTGMFLGPLLNAAVDAHGWRAAYQIVAAVTAVAGLATFLLTPRDAGVGASSRAALAGRPRRSAREDYPAIFRLPAFWILLAAMLLCNLPTTILLVQLKLVLLANGATGATVGVLIAASSGGTLAGRFVTGVALDRYHPLVIAVIGLGLPAIGLYMIAAGVGTPVMLGLAVFAIGFAFGSEGDIIAFLVARYFGVEIYSSTMGLLTAAMSFSVATGAVVLSYTLKATGGYATFLTLAGVAVLAGAAITALLAWFPQRQTDARTVPIVPPMPEPVV